MFGLGAPLAGLRRISMVLVAGCKKYLLGM